MCDQWQFKAIIMLIVATSTAMMHFSFIIFISGRSRPTITPDGPQLTVPLNGNFILHCQSDSSVRWLREDRPTRTLKEEQRDGLFTVLKVPKAGPQHMGKYSCREDSSGEKSSIYVYVKGKLNFRTFGVCMVGCYNLL